MSKRSAPNSDLAARAAEATAAQERRRAADIRRNEVAKRARLARESGGRLIYTVAEVAAALDKNEATIFRWIKHEKLRSVRIGNSRMIPAAELDRLLGGAPRAS
jgi:excisionase family DNA binding protein